MSLLDQLVEMGFEENMAKEALVSTNESGLIEAVEWIDAQQKKSSDERSSDNVASLSTTQQSDSRQQTEAAEKPMSFKCDECGKHMADEQAVMFHAARTKHEAFSESTEIVQPLSDTEKRERLINLQIKLKEARTKKAEQEKKEEIDRELRRRKDGQAAEKLRLEKKDAEMKKMVEVRKREKKEAEEARKNVLAQINLDRAAQKIAVEGMPVPSKVTPQQIMPTVEPGFCHIQVRLPNGSLIKEKFKPDEPLSHVRVWVQLGAEGILDHMKFSLMMPFPRRVFCAADMDAPLRELGLTPSANLVVVRVTTDC